MYNVRKHGWLDKVVNSIMWISLTGIVVVVILGGLLFELRGCSGNEDEVRDLLEGQGYRDVDVGGADKWSCSDSDTYSNSFSAVGQNGRTVHGVVCCGLIAKGCTVRFK